MSGLPASSRGSSLAFDEALTEDPPPATILEFHPAVVASVNAEAARVEAARLETVRALSIREQALRVADAAAADADAATAGLTVAQRFGDAALFGMPSGVMSDPWAPARLGYIEDDARPHLDDIGRGRTLPPLFAAYLRAAGRRETDRHSDEDRQRQRALLVALVEQACRRPPLPSGFDGARERALRALAEATEAFDSCEAPRPDSELTTFPLIGIAEFFDETSAVLLTAAVDPVDAIREQALMALSRLAHNGDIARQLWDDNASRGARALFIAGAANMQPEGIRYASHYALSLIVCHNATAALQLWSHPPSRAVVLSTIRRGEGDDVVPLRVKLEAWDVLLNTCKGMRAGLAPTERARYESLFRHLWQESEDVRRVIVAACNDVTEHERAQLKALSCVLLIVSWRPMATFTWEQEAVVRAVLALATDATFVNARRLALQVLLSLQISEEAPRGPEDGAVVLAALLAAAEGSAAVLDSQLRQRCAAEHDRLEQLATTRSNEPLRKQPRYALLDLEERLKRLRELWRRLAVQPAFGGDPSSMDYMDDGLVIPLRVDTISEDLLRYVGELDAGRLAAGLRSVRVKLDHGSDAGGLKRHAFSEFGKGLLELEGASKTGVALIGAKELLGKFKPYSSQRSQERELLCKLQATIAAAIAEEEDEADSGAPPAAKRQRSEGATAKLFKLTERGSLAPSGAESLSKCVGKAVQGIALAPKVPEVSSDPSFGPILTNCANLRPLLRPSLTRCPCAPPGERSYAGSVQGGWPCVRARTGQ